MSSWPTVCCARTVSAFTTASGSAAFTICTGLEVNAELNSQHVIYSYEHCLSSGLVKGKKKKNVSAQLDVELKGGKSINVCHILCQKRRNCSPLNQRGVWWASSDETAVCCCLHQPQRGQQAGDHRDDLRPESLVNS